MDLGNCPKCQNKLAVYTRGKFRVENDRKIFLGEDGQEIQQDRHGRWTGKPERESVVRCGECGLESREHPYQKELDAAAAKAKAAPPPTPPAFNTTKYTEANGFDAMERRLGKVEAALLLATGRIEKLEQDMAERDARIDALEEEATSAVTAGGRGRRKGV